MGVCGADDSGASEREQIVLTSVSPTSLNAFKTPSDSTLFNGSGFRVSRLRVSAPESQYWHPIPANATPSLPSVAFFDDGVREGGWGSRFGGEEEEADPDVDSEKDTSPLLSRRLEQARELQCRRMNGETMPDILPSSSLLCGLPLVLSCYSSPPSAPTTLRPARFLSSHSTSAPPPSIFGNGAKSQNMDLHGVGARCGPRNSIDLLEYWAAFTTPRFWRRPRANWDDADLRVDYIGNWGQAGRRWAGTGVPLWLRQGAADSVDRYFQAEIQSAGIVSSAVGNISLQDSSVALRGPRPICDASQGPSSWSPQYLNPSRCRSLLVLVTGREDDHDDDRDIGAKPTQQARLSSVYSRRGCC
ncbi:hypothetical protein C8F01DRAFT_1092997 [Mycena amicta]|nr:hypothetical protein C8F01DRAFT_1092997 [Mycena amicta]